MRMRCEGTRQIRLLVVDDEQVTAISMGTILKMHGYEVATAFSGEEALVKAADFVPDLLVTDISMGVMNGIEAATRITATLPDCTVLFVSGHAAWSDVLTAVPKRMVYRFVSKPIHPLDLLDAIASMLPSASTEEGLIAKAVAHDASPGRQPGTQEQIAC